MRKLAVAAIAAVMATVGVSMNAGAESRIGNDGRGGDDRWNSSSSVYWHYGDRRNWRRHNRWSGHVVVRSDLGSCYKQRYDGSIKIRRRCR